MKWFNLFSLSIFLLLLASTGFPRDPRGVLELPDIRPSGRENPILILGISTLEARRGEILTTGQATEVDVSGIKIPGADFRKSYWITANHLVDGYQVITLGSGLRREYARPVYQDHLLDLAILESDRSPRSDFRDFMRTFFSILHERYGSRPISIFYEEKSGNQGSSAISFYEPIEKEERALYLRDYSNVKAQAYSRTAISFTWRALGFPGRSGNPLVGEDSSGNPILLGVFSSYSVVGGYSRFINPHALLRRLELDLPATQSNNGILTVPLAGGATTLLRVSGDVFRSTGERFGGDTGGHEGHGGDTGGHEGHGGHPLKSRRLFLLERAYADWLAEFPAIEIPGTGTRISIDPKTPLSHLSQLYEWISIPLVSHAGGSESPEKWFSAREDVFRSRIQKKASAAFVDLSGLIPETANDIEREITYQDLFSGRDGSNLVKIRIDRRATRQELRLRVSVSPAIGPTSTLDYLVGFAGSTPTCNVMTNQARPAPTRPSCNARIEQNTLTLTTTGGPRLDLLADPESGVAKSGLIWDALFGNRPPATRLIYLDYGKKGWSAPW